MAQRRIPGRAAVQLTGLFALVAGCGDDADAVGGGGAGGEGGTGGGVPTVTISGVLGSFEGFTPIEGGQVCFVSEGANDRCTPTGVEGAYALAGLPRVTQGSLRFMGPGLAEFHWILATSEQDVVLPSVFPESPELLAAWYTQAGLAEDSSSVVVQVQVNSPQPEGWVVELSPATSDGPYYWDGDWTEGSTMLDLDATATGTTPVGIFLNVDANGGPYAVKATRGATVCDTVEFSAPISNWTVPGGAEEVFVQLECP